MHPSHLGGTLFTIFHSWTVLTLVLSDCRAICAETTRWPHLRSSGLHHSHCSFYEDISKAGQQGYNSTGKPTLLYWLYLIPLRWLWLETGHIRCEYQVCERCADLYIWSLLCQRSLKPNLSLVYVRSSPSTQSLYLPQTRKAWLPLRKKKLQLQKPNFKYDRSRICVLSGQF